MPVPGKSTVLANIARCALDADAAVDIHAIASTWSPLLLLPRLTARRRWPASTSGRPSSSTRAIPRLVLVDDADRLDGEVFERLAALDDPRLVVIAAGRTREPRTSRPLDCAAAPLASRCDSAPPRRRRRDVRSAPACHLVASGRRSRAADRRRHDDTRVPGVGPARRRRRAIEVPADRQLEQVGRHA